jgi:hypothetical protein
MTLASLTAEVVSGESVVPGCDATEVFAAAEHGLDAPAIPVAAVVVLDRTLAIAAAGDDRDRALLAQATPERHLLQPRTLRAREERSQIRPFGYYSAPDFGFRRERAAFPLHWHKTTSGRFAPPIQYRPNVCSSRRHASLKSRSGSMCLSIQFARISSIVMFGAR